MKAWKSGAWTISGQAMAITINLSTLAVLGRLLTPAEFGVFGLVLAVQALVLPILDMGLQPAYLKLELADSDASNAFFTVNVLIGGLISFLIFFLS